MSIQPILEFPDERLRQVSAQVTTFGGPARDLVGDLLETLYATTAIALSAPQINAFQKVLVMDLSGDRSAPRAYINPEILLKGAWGFVEESCLSLPGVVGNVLRATQIRVRAQDVDGDVFERDLGGMDAVCLQHELDHLEGKLFIDRMSVFRRMSVRARLKREGRQAHQA